MAILAAPPLHVPNAVVVSGQKSNTTELSQNDTLISDVLPAKTDTDTKRQQRLLGLELSLGLGGYGYGGLGYGGLGYGGLGPVPYPCSTVRLAALGFPYYNPACYGYSVPSFPYYGGVLG